MKGSEGCETEYQALGVLTIIYGTWLASPSNFMEPGMLVMDQIYMLKPPGTIKRKAITAVHNIGKKGAANP